MKNKLKNKKKLTIRQEISKKYNLKLKDINIDLAFDQNDINVFNPTVNVNNLSETEPIYWFLMNDKKYVMKDMFDICVRYEEVTDKMSKKERENQIAENINIKKQIINFWKTSMKDFKIFPKFLEETDDFYIFEYISGTSITTREEFLKHKYTYLNEMKNILIKTKHLLPTRSIPYNWIIDKNDNLRFVNIRSFDSYKFMDLFYEFDDKKEYLKSSNIVQMQKIFDI